VPLQPWIAEADGELERVRRMSSATSPILVVLPDCKQLAAGSYQALPIGECD
jgi:hypothetical protein